jgi:HEAT repeat protein
MLTAKQFADELNSGTLSANNAFENYWGYKENAEIWDLPKDKEWITINPAWRKILIFSASQLKQEIVCDITNIALESYLSFSVLCQQRVYNPFKDDLKTVSDFVLASRINPALFQGIYEIYKNIVSFKSHASSYHPDHPERKTAILYMYKFSEPKQIPEVIACLKEFQSDERDDISINLAKLGCNEVTPILKSAMRMKRNERNIFPIGNNQFYNALKNIETEHNVDRLISILRYKNELDLDAINELGDLKDQRATIPLIECLSNPIWYLNSAVIEALEKIGDKRAVRNLIEFAHNSKELLAYGPAIRAIGVLGGNEATQGLLGLLDNVDPHKREYAIQSLAASKYNGPEQPLLDYYKLASEKEKELILRILANVGGKATIELLRSEIQSGKGKVAAYPLRLIGTPEAIDIMIDGLLTGDQGCLLEFIGFNGDEITDKIIFKANICKHKINGNILSELRHISGHKFLELYVDYLRDPKNQDREKVLKAIVDFDRLNYKLSDHQHNLIGRAVLEYLKDTNNKGREDAALILGKVKAKYAIYELIKYIKDPSNPKREKAIVSLGDIGEEEAIPTIIEFMNSLGEKWNENDCLEAIGKIGAKGSNIAIQTLVDYIDRHDISYCSNAILALLKTGSDQILRYLDNFLKQSSWITSDDIITEIGKRRYDKAVPILRTRLYDKLQEPNRIILEALGQIATPSAVQVLSDYYCDSEGTNEYAMIALSKHVSESCDERVINLLINYVMHNYSECRDAEDGLKRIGYNRVLTKILKYDNSNFVYPQYTFSEATFENAARIENSEIPFPYSLLSEFQKVIKSTEIYYGKKRN